MATPTSRRAPAADGLIEERDALCAELIVLEREGLPRRVYTVTPSGLSALRAEREVLRRMWRGLEHLLKERTS